MEKGETTGQYKVWSAVNPEESDQFQLLEEKIDKLIMTIKALKTEREALNEKLHIQEERLNDLIKEGDGLKSARDQARQRIVYLLEKIEQMDV